LDPWEVRVIASTHALVQRFLVGDQSAFGQLFDRYRELVYRLCLRRLGHQQDAEDATQETFTRLARSLHRWDQSRPLEPWLVTIASNRCRTLQTRRRPWQMMHDGLEPYHETGDQQRAAEQLDEEMQRALCDLRAEHREAFLLFHQEQLSYAEIALRMGCPLGTVKTWVHRARNDLVVCLKSRQVIEGAARGL
jgi:RNA polymerase sigma-70 factor (ECF subfamily)